MNLNKKETIDKMIKSNEYHIITLHELVDFYKTKKFNKEDLLYVLTNFTIPESLLNSTDKLFNYLLKELKDTRESQILKNHNIDQIVTSITKNKDSVLFRDPSIVQIKLLIELGLRNDNIYINKIKDQHLNNILNRTKMHNHLNSYLIFNYSLSKYKKDNFIIKFIEKYPEEFHISYCKEKYLDFSHDILISIILASKTNINLNNKHNKLTTYTWLCLKLFLDDRSLYGEWVNYLSEKFKQHKITIKTYKECYKELSKVRNNISTKEKLKSYNKFMNFLLSKIYNTKINDKNNFLINPNLIEQSLSEVSQYLLNSQKGIKYLGKSIKNRSFTNDLNLLYIGKELNLNTDIVKNHLFKHACFFENSFDFFTELRKYYSLHKTLRYITENNCSLDTTEDTFNLLRAFSLNDVAREFIPKKVKGISDLHESLRLNARLLKVDEIFDLDQDINNLDNLNFQDFKLHTPKTNLDHHQAGVMLRNCLGTYSLRVKNKRDKIFFLKNDKELKYAVRLNTNNEIVEVEGSPTNRDMTSDMMVKLQSTISHSL